MYLTINKIDDANRVIKCDTFKTLDDANARIEELKDLGLTDAFVIDTKTLSKNFSLGEIKHLTGDASSKKVTWHQDTFDSAEASRLLESVRIQRNNLLAETDWLAFPDSPEMTDSQTKYRQDLRDITKQDDLNNITWPTKPS